MNAYNCVIGFPIYSDVGVVQTPTLSTGSWLAGNPLTNLQDRRLQKVARSTDATTASTQFEVDLKVARAVRVIALPYHTISSVGTIRVRGFTGAGKTGSTVYDSGTLTAWESGLTAENTAGLNIGFTLVPTADQTARYWVFEITDTANAAGYVDVGRLILAAGWQASTNMQYGAQLGLETETVRTVTDGGAAVFNAKAVRRNIKFTIANIPESEALASAFDLQRLAGTAGQMHFVFDPTTTTNMHRSAFLATLRQLSAIEYPYAGFNTVPFELVEEL